jgi:hypothetical protein
VLDRLHERYAPSMPDAGKVVKQAGHVLTLPLRLAGRLLTGTARRLTGRGN